MEIIKSEKGSLTILTGKTDMGKSTITVYDASEYLKLGQRVIFFSYEYCQSIIYNKLISHFGASWSTLFNLNIIDVIYIDYLDLLKQATYGNETSESASLGQIQTIVAELSSLAQELGIAIVLLSQVGSSSDFEKIISRLNAFSEKAKANNVIKMFIGKGNVIDSRIQYDDIVHVILVDGYDLRHFSSVNVKEIYKADSSR